jgi:PAS domain S-box-containing protein
MDKKAPQIVSEPIVQNSMDVSFITSFTDSLPFAVYTCDSQGRILSYNKMAVKLWGREPEIGKDQWCGSWKIFDTDGTQIPLENGPMARVLKTGEKIPLEEIAIQRPDGTIRNVLPHPSPIFSPQGELLGAVNTLVDITDQKSGEVKQALLAAIIESSDDAIISKTLQGIITSFNRSAEQLFGYKESEVIGKSITVLIPTERLSEEDLIIGKIRKGEKVDHFETYRVTKSGQQVPISLTVSPVKDQNGVIIGASKIVRDITRQKESEEILQRYAENLEILNTVSKMVSEDMDVQGILQKVTDATTQLTGAGFGAFFYNTVDEKGESYMLYTLSGVEREAFESFGMPRNTAVFHPTFSGEGIMRVDDITKDPRYGQNDPHYGMPKGHLPVVSYLAVPVKAKSGAVIGGLFFGHPEPAKFTAEHESLVDGIAAHAAVALDNAKLYEEVKQFNLKKDEFIGLASHELKTPMASISGYLQIIERSPLDSERSKAFIQKVRQQVTKLSSLIADLLDVSKIQTGKLSFSFTKFDIISVLNEAVEMMQHSNDSHTIEWKPGLATAIVVADQQRMEQVIINLLSNAIKYSPDGKNVIVSVSKGDNTIKVSVRDFGIGIDKKHQEQIFSRFYRVENLAAHMSGLGIGLYISHEIIARHNGELKVVSQPGEGSTFSFEIPVAQ